MTASVTIDGVKYDVDIRLDGVKYDNPAILVESVYRREY
jgi:hypothetical protein